MKASELIEKLQAAIETYGDLDVTFWSDEQEEDISIEEVGVYNEANEEIEMGEKAVLLTVQ